MIGNEQVLQDIVRIAKSGRDFFSETSSRVTDTEVRTAFVYLSEVKTRLIDELIPWVPRAKDTAPGSPSAIVPSVIVTEKLYMDARTNFRSNQPESIANALSFGEDQLLKLVERAFNAARAPALKQLLKSYYAELSICRDAMSRLRARLAA